MSKNSIFGFLFSNWLSHSNRYEKISADEEKKQKSVYFGVSSIIESVFAAVTAAAGVWLLLRVSEYNTKDWLITVLLLVFGVALLIVSLPTWITAMMDLRYQMKMNKKPIRWIALAVLFLSVAACVVAVIILA